MSISALRGLAGAFAFEGLFRAGFFRSNLDLDLLRLGFGLLGQRDLQHALVVVGRDVLGVHGLGQSEGASEAAVLALHAAVVFFFLFLLDLALAVHGQRAVLHADIDVFLVDARDFDLQRDLVFVFVDVNGGSKGAGRKGLVLASGVGLAENAIDAVLQGGKFTERLPTGQYGHG